MTWKALKGRMAPICQTEHPVSGEIPLSSPLNPHIYGQYTEATIKTNETHDKLRPGNPYLTAALGHDLLTAEREAELGRRALSGDIEARNTLVMQNQRFLLKTVAEFHSRHNHLEFEDLVSEANLALLRAAEKFDPETGNRFITYARYWILQALTRFSDQHSLPVRLPDHRAEELKKLRTASCETGKTDISSLSLSSGLDEESVRLLLPFLNGTVSLDAPVSTPSGEEGACLGDLVCPVTVDFIGNLQAIQLIILR